MSSTDPRSSRHLFAPLQIRGVTLPNRIAVSPMCMYSASNGHVSDYHLVHLGRFALGGAGLVVMEATAVSEDGRISHHDTGLWSDDQVPGMARIASFIESRGAVPGIQLSHAGRKASVTEPWHGGRPLGDGDADVGFGPWPVVGPSAIAAGPGFPKPMAPDGDGISSMVQAWADAARRAVAAGFRVIELHGAHGYLLHSFLSPISNLRDDQYGGSPSARMRFPIRVIEAVRDAIGDDIALFYRVSAVDGIDGGLTLSDTVEFCHAAAEAGVDLIDTSSGGVVTDRSIDTRVRRGFAFHADFSRELKHELGIAVATVGLVVDPLQAELLLETGDADLVMLGREMLDDPNWALHARRHFDADEIAHWHVEAASALEARGRTLDKLRQSGLSPVSRFDKLA